MTDAQSEVIGVIILLAMSMLAIGMIFLFGQGSIQGIQDSTQQERMMNEFALLDSSIAASALGESESQSARVNLGGGTLISNSTGTVMNITYRNDTDPSKNFNEVINIGNVKYEHKDRVLGYEGGGVWMKDEGAKQSRMVSPPEFHYNRQTMTLPMFNITDDIRVSGDKGWFRAEGGETEVVLPNESRNITPLPAGNVTVKVEGTEFYEAWATYFEDRTQGINVKTYDNNNTAEMTLPVPEPGNVEEAILGQDPSSGEGTGLTLQLGGGYIDAYSGGQYQDSNSHETECSSGSLDAGYDSTGAIISTPGDYKLDTGGPEICIYGDVISERDVEFANEDMYISGDVIAGSTGQSNQGDLLAGSAENSYIGGSADVHGSVKMADGVEIAGDVNATDIQQMGDGAEIGGDVRLTKNGNVLDCDNNANIVGDVYTDANNVDSEPCVTSGQVQPLSPSDPILTKDIENSKHEMGNFPSSYSNSKGLTEGSNSPDCADLESDLTTTCTISEDGGYYLSELKMDGGELVIDADVEMSVGGDVDIDGDCVEVAGELTMHVDDGTELDMQNLDFLSGDGSGLPCSSGDQHDSTRTIINMHSNSNQGFDAGEVAFDNVDYAGVLMAPHTKDPNIDNSDIYGALIVGGNGNPTESNVHYDTDLQGLNFPTGVSQIYYLHITENKIELE